MPMQEIVTQFEKNRYFINIMFNKQILIIKTNIILLATAAFVGLVVSLVAQLFILSAKNLYEFFYQNSDNIFVMKIYNIDINISSISSKISLLGLFRAKAFFKLVPKFVDVLLNPPFNLLNQFFII